jgi:hypothetical protein
VFKTRPNERKVTAHTKIPEVCVEIGFLGSDRFVFMTVRISSIASTPYVKGELEKELFSALQYLQ